MTDSSRQTDPVRLILLVLALIIGLPLLMMALFIPFGMMGVWGVGMHDGPGMFDGFGGVGAIELLVITLMGLVPLLLLVGGGYLLYRAIRSNGSHRRGEDPVLEELRLAYARGDLSDEEYEERRERLTDDRIENR